MIAPCHSPCLPILSARIPGGKLLSSIGNRGGLSLSILVRRRPRSMVKWAKAIALMVSALAGLSLLAWKTLPWSPARPPTFENSLGRTKLAHALSERSPCTAWLIGFPLQHSGLVALRGPLLNEAKLTIQRTLKRKPSPEALSDAAVLSLAAGRVDEGISLLEQAADQAPQRPEILSDLAAAYLHRARQASDPYSLVKALEVADRALGEKPTLPEALFNRALALSELRLDLEALMAWRRFLATNPVSARHSEALERLSELTRPTTCELWQSARKDLEAWARRGDVEGVRTIVSRFPQQSRVFTEETLLSSWADHLSAGKRTEAASDLQAAYLIAAALYDHGGDPLLSETVSAIEQTRGDSGILARGHQLYRKARELHEQSRYLEAAPLFDEAAETLEQGGSPFAAWARFYRAVTVYHLPDHQNALRRLLLLRKKSTDVTRYRALLGYIDWMLGLTEARLAGYTRALGYYRSSREQFIALGETENRAHMDNLIADEYDDLGDPVLAWQFQFNALSSRGDLCKPRRIQDLLTNTFYRLRETGAFSVALYFQDDFVRESFRVGNPVGITIALRQRADLLYRLRLYRESLVDIELAWSHSQKIPGAGLRRQHQTELMIIEGRIRGEEEPQVAIDLLTEALERATVADDRQFWIEALVERARILSRIGDLDQAEADLLASLEELERQRAMIDGVRFRRMYVDQSRRLFEQLVLLELSRGDSNRAFTYGEQMRGRALLDATLHYFDEADSTGVPPLPLAAMIARELPLGTALLELLVLPNRTLLWVLRQEGVSFVEIKSKSRELADRVRKFGAAIRGRREPDATLLGKELYSRLIVPVLPHLSGIESLILIPDLDLHLLSFAALRSPDSGRLLIEDFSLSTVSSAQVYMRISRRAERLGKSLPQSALLVGSFDFDRAAYPDLPSLHSVSRELQQIRDIYPKAVSLTGRRATVKNFLENFLKSDVLQFSGHALVAVDPSRSQLILSPSDGGTGALFAEKIAFVGESQTRLVVLATCRSAGGPVSASEGPVSLALPFLAEGVPTVLGSLWAVDDGRAVDILVEFHRHFRNGEGAASALRKAQLAALRSGDIDPYTWAGFQIMGYSK